MFGEILGRFNQHDTHWNLDNIIYGDNQPTKRVISVLKEEFKSDLSRINKDVEVSVNQKDLQGLDLNLRRDNSKFNIKGGYNNEETVYCTIGTIKYKLWVCIKKYILW